MRAGLIPHMGATGEIQAGLAPPTAGIPVAGPLLDTADLAVLPPVMADRAELRAIAGPGGHLPAMVGPVVDPATVVRRVHLATAVAAAQVAAHTIQGRVVDITPVAGPPPVVAADTPAAVVGDTPVAAAIPVEEDMAEVIAKKLGDSKSLREAAT
jgi:hypothetical protein